MRQGKIYKIVYVTKNKDGLHTYEVDWKLGWAKTIARAAYDNHKEVWQSVSILECEPTKFGDFTATKCVFFVNAEQEINI